MSNKKGDDMNKNIEKQYTIPFINGHEEERKKILKQTYKIALESISGELTNETSELFLTISNNFERISNSINVSDPNKKEAFDYGFLYGVVSIINDLNKKAAEDVETTMFSNRYKLLYPVLSFVFANRKVTGKQIKEELNFKNDSNLTNFISRIKKYNLIYIQKTGTINYYSLTNKGKRIYRSIKNKNMNYSLTESNYITESVFLDVLGSIAKQMIEPEPKSSEIIKMIVKSNTVLKNKSVFKYKINSIFLSRDQYLKDYFNKNFETKVKNNRKQFKEYIDREYNSYDENITEYTFPLKAEFYK